MKTTIAIGVLGFALVPLAAAAQSVAEQARILRDFRASVADYTTRHQCLDLFPEAINATTPAPRIFTLPVAMVFRQVIAKTLAERVGVVPVSGVGDRLEEFPRVLQDALPPLPTPLEYRLIGHDLVIRDREADLIVGVLRDAVGPALAVIR